MHIFISPRCATSRRILPSLLTASRRVRATTALHAPSVVIMSTLSKRVLRSTDVPVQKPAKKLKGSTAVPITTAYAKGSGSKLGVVLRRRGPEQRGRKKMGKMCIFLLQVKLQKRILLLRFSNERKVRKMWWILLLLEPVRRRRRLLLMFTEGEKVSIVSEAEAMGVLATYIHIHPVACSVVVSFVV